MFWPVAVAAFFIDLPFAIGIALLAPLLSFLMTGMPPISPPILPMLTVELLGLLLAISFFYKRAKWGIVLSLFMGLIVTRIILLFTIYVAAPIIGLPRTVFSLNMLTHGWAGLSVLVLIFAPIFLIVVVVSVIVSRIKREPLIVHR